MKSSSKVSGRSEHYEFMRGKSKEHLCFDHAYKSYVHSKRRCLLKLSFDELYHKI